MPRTKRENSQSLLLRGRVARAQVAHENNGISLSGVSSTLPPVFLLSSWFFPDPPDPLWRVALNPRIPPI